MTKLRPMRINRNRDLRDQLSTVSKCKPTKKLSFLVLFQVFSTNLQSLVLMIILQRIQVLTVKLLSIFDSTKQTKSMHRSYWSKRDSDLARNKNKICNYIGVITMPPNTSNSSNL